MRYIRQIDTLEGWLSGTTAFAMAETLRFQSRNGISGKIAEIGIHHGKSFITLAIASNPTDDLIATDCFDNQEANVDFSGHGNLASFKNNLERFVPHRSVRIIASDSLEVSKRLDELSINDVRFFSIDGGHTRKITLNDLQIADKTLHDSGVCVLDDILNSHWTGVISGLWDFLRSSRGLVPCAMLPNKLVLCRPDKVALYSGFYRNVFSPALEKRNVEFLDWEIDVYGELPAQEWPDFVTFDQSRRIMPKSRRLPLAMLAWVRRSSLRGRSLTKVITRQA
jgi:hypothetical protein